MRHYGTSHRTLDSLHFGARGFDTLVDIYIEFATLELPTSISIQEKALLLERTSITKVKVTKVRRIKTTNHP